MCHIWRLGFKNAVLALSAAHTAQIRNWCPGRRQTNSCEFGCCGVAGARSKTTFAIWLARRIVGLRLGITAGPAECGIIARAQRFRTI
jgi:hypothetical protein